MSWSRIYAVAIALTMLFSLSTTYSLAGETEKYKATATSINTQWHELEVGDVEGHVIGLFQNTQVWVYDETGEKATQYSRGMMDFNRKTGQGTMQGYGVMTYASGDKRFSKYDGKIVGKGQWEGTYTDINGTGKYEGCKGGGTWKSQSLGRGISHVTAEGERTFK
jgi:hypothetical protein